MRKSCASGCHSLRSKLICWHLRLGLIKKTLQLWKCIAPTSCLFEHGKNPEGVWQTNDGTFTSYSGSKHSQLNV